jgi:hypothetical protein
MSKFSTGLTKYQKAAIPLEPIALCQLSHRLLLTVLYPLPTVLNLMAIVNWQLPTVHTIYLLHL